MTITDRQPRNGVDVPTLFATLDAVKDNPTIARFQFRATNEWVTGTHSRSTIDTFHGAMQELAHTEPRAIDADHPAILVGRDNGPTPVEFLLHALAACLTAGIANIASARGISLDSVTSRVEGDINLMGLLGLDDGVRNGYQSIRVSLSLHGSDPDALRTVVEQSMARSAVLDCLTRPCTVSVDVDVH